MMFVMVATTASQFTEQVLIAAGVPTAAAVSLGPAA